MQSWDREGERVESELGGKDMSSDGAKPAENQLFLFWQSDDVTRCLQLRLRKLRRQQLLQ